MTKRNTSVAGANRKPRQSGDAGNDGSGKPRTYQEWQSDNQKAIGRLLKNDRISLQDLCTMRWSGSKNSGRTTQPSPCKGSQKRGQQRGKVRTSQECRFASNNRWQAQAVVRTISCQVSGKLLGGQTTAAVSFSSVAVHKTAVAVEFLNRFICTENPVLIYASKRIYAGDNN